MPGTHGLRRDICHFPHLLGSIWGKERGAGMYQTFESILFKVMEIPSCLAQAAPAGFNLTFLGHLSF